jgi:hypothetical protein
VFLVFQEFDRAVDIHQLLLRLFDSLQCLTQLQLIRTGHFAQRLIDSLGAGEDETRTTIALFQPLQSALQVIVVGSRVARHGINLSSRFE